MTPSGRVSYVDRYATIPFEGTGTLGTDFYRSVTQYDLLGRQQYDIQVVRGSASSNRVEQVTQYVYDVRDRVIEVKQGVSGDTAANSHDMTDNYNSYPTLVTLSRPNTTMAALGMATSPSRSVTTARGQTITPVVTSSGPIAATSAG
jgi:hypothetical protein